MTRSGRVTRRPRELQQVPKGSEAKIKRHRETFEGWARVKLAKKPSTLCTFEGVLRRVPRDKIVNRIAVEVK